MSNMKTVAVIFGGRSAEHDVSILTAIGRIIKPLELTKQYKVEAVYISKNGAWYCDDIFKDISIFTSGKIEAVLQKQKPVRMKFDGGLSFVKTGFTSNKSQKIDVVFPAMHGTNGEDGSLAGFLNMANVPYVGCDLSPSVIAMDKVLAKQIAISNNIPTPRMCFITKILFQANPQEFIDKVEGSLKYPLFVKPAHLGSSIGINKANNSEELQNAIEIALHYDKKILVEEAVDNLIELTLPIMGNDSLQPALLEQPLVNSGDFFDFETKYMQGGKKGKGKTSDKRGSQGYSKLPADVPDAIYKNAEKLALDVYRALECKGISRVDLLVDSKEKKIYFNELNPLPGDLYAHNWAKSGVSSVRLVQELVELAEKNWRDNNKLATAFETNYLKQF